MKPGSFQQSSVPGPGEMGTNWNIGAALLCCASDALWRSSEAASILAWALCSVSPCLSKCWTRWLLCKPQPVCDSMKVSGAVLRIFITRTSL